MDAILHIASPLYRTAPAGVWKNIIEPAKVGTTAIMSAALKHNPNVKRIVITSSYAGRLSSCLTGSAGDKFVVAVADGSRTPGTVFTEKDWNISCVSV